MGDHDLVKVDSFYLSKMIGDNVYFAKGGQIPIKWTAPEGLMDGIFTLKSDIWCKL